MPLSPERFYEFGPFRLDAEEHLLFRNGERIELAPKVLDTLIVLVENHEHLVTKEELIQRLWPETFVEESNLTFNLSTLRKVLGDDRKNRNRFIETVPKRGYRFIAPVQFVETSSGPRESDASAGKGSTEPSQRPIISRVALWISAVAAGVLGVGVVTYKLARPAPRPRILGYHALTHDGREKASGVPPLTDGVRIYFQEALEAPNALTAVAVAGGDIDKITVPFNHARLCDIMPRQNLALLHADGELWEWDPPAGSPRRLGIKSDGNGTLSPDGQFIAYELGRSVYRATVDGSQPRRLFDVSGTPEGSIRISPDGSTLALTVRDAQGYRSIWQCSSEGRNLHEILAGWHNPPDEGFGDWTPDGKWFVFVSPANRPAANLWALREKALWPFSKNSLVQLNRDEWRYGAPLASADPHRIFADVHTPRGELQKYDRRLRDFVNTLRRISAAWVRFSSEGNYVAYVKYPDRTLWTARSDGSGPTQLTFAPMEVRGFDFSPDGGQIAVNARRDSSQVYKIYILSPHERSIRELTTGVSNEQGIPTWSADGAHITFGDVPPVYNQGTPENVIHISDASTGLTTTLPNSQGLWTSRWSPNGRYIAALTADDRQRIRLYDFRSGAWRDLGVEYVNNPIWSRNNEFIYFGRVSPLADSGIYRIRVRDRTVQIVTDFKGLSPIESLVGLTPDDSPLILRDIGTSEIYALDVDWP